MDDFEKMNRRELTIAAQSGGAGQGAVVESNLRACDATERLIATTHELRVATDRSAKSMYKPTCWIAVLTAVIAVDAGLKIVKPFTG